MNDRAIFLLAQFRELNAKRTPGPWDNDGMVREDRDRPKHHNRDPFWENGAGIVAPGGEVVCGGQQDEQGGAVGVIRNDDAEFISWCGTHLEELIELLGV